MVVVAAAVVGGAAVVLGVVVGAVPLVVGDVEALVLGLVAGWDEPPQAPARRTADKATRAGAARTRTVSPAGTPALVAFTETARPGRPGDECRDTLPWARGGHQTRGFDMQQGARFSQRAGRGGLALLAAAVVTLGACGNPIARITTERAVGNAFGAVLSQPNVDLQVSLGVTAQQLQQLSSQLGKTSLSPKVAASIAGMSLVFELNTGHGEHLNSAQARTDHANQFSFALQIGSSAPVEIRYLAGSIFARADASTLLGDFGLAPAEAASFRHALQRANAYLPGLAALGQGQWVSVQTAAFAPLLNGLKAKVPATTPASSKKLLDQLKAAFTNNATYSNAGTHGGRTEYNVTVAAHNLVQQLAGLVPSAISSVPGASSATKSLGSLASKIPATQTVVLQVWVSGNKAQEIDLDLNQFDHKLPFAVPLKVLIGSGAPVAAPTGATPLDLSKLSTLFSGLLGGGLGSNSQSSSSPTSAAA
jgi:hypothetical protein